jgi:ribosomal protein S18 acetylase RimI-like enzyme
VSAPASELALRPIAPGDIPAIVALHRRALPRDFITSLGERFLAEVFYAAILAREEGVGVVARRGDALAGFVVGAHPAESWYPALLREHRSALARGVVSRLASGPEALLELGEVAFAMLKGSSDPAGFPADLGYIAVSEAARGAGVGAALVRRFLDALRARGAAGCWTKTYASNAAARRLYERSGFHEIGRRRIRRIESVYYGVALSSTSEEPSSR